MLFGVYNRAPGFLEIYLSQKIENLVYRYPGPGGFFGGISGSKRLVLGGCGYRELF